MSQLMSFSMVGFDFLTTPKAPGQVAETHPEYAPGN
jgi:hypothetical protein